MKYDNTNFNGILVSDSIVRAIEAIDGVISNSVERTYKETDNDVVIRFIKGDFEKVTGMSFDKFKDVYMDILEKNPEKLI